MKYFDIFSSPTPLYIFNQAKAKNNVSGFSSFLFLLSMLSITIYYFYRYFSKKDYNLQYYRVNWTSQFSDNQKKEIDVQKNIYFYIEKFPKYYNPKINGYFFDRDNNYTPFEKCETQDDYCFKLSFYHLKKEGNTSFFLRCEENCTDENGNPLTLQIGIYFKNFYLDHDSDNPLIFSETLYGDRMYVKTSSKYRSYHLFEFTPIVYTTSQILSTENKEYVDIYFSSNNNRDSYYDDNNDGLFFGFNLVVATHSEVYKREYISLLDTISKIGGLFSTFRLGFSLLVMIYSEYANNYELSKDIIKKKYKYLAYLKNNNKLDNIIENKLEDNIENKIDNISQENNKGDIKFNNFVAKAKKINGFQHFFFTLFCCCKNGKTMKILNLSNNYVMDYLSADNIIFNMMLFENFYKDNPVNIIKDNKLKNLENELFYKEVNQEDKNPLKYELKNDFESYN